MDDVVQALKLAAERGQGPINVGTGKSHPFNEVLDFLSSRTGIDVRKRVDFVPIPKDYLLRQVADTTKAEKDLGFKAEIDLETGLRTLI